MDEQEQATTLTSNSKSAVSIGPDGTASANAQATVSNGDRTETVSVSVSDSNSDMTGDDENDPISVPQEDISEVRQAESSQAESFFISSGINNGSFEGTSFETGTFNNWRTIGDTSIETEEIGIAPTDGESQALITTGFSDSGGSVEESDLSQFLGLSSVDPLLDGNTTEGSGIKQTFTAQAGDILEFDYRFLTSEATPSGTFNDSAFFSLGNFALEIGDTSDPTFSSVPEVEGFSEVTDSKTIKIGISNAGTYDLGFGIVDLTDSIVDSGILIDDVKVSQGGISAFASSSAGDSASQTDAVVSSDVDFIFGSNGFEPISGSSNTQQ